MWISWLIGSGLPRASLAAFESRMCANLVAVLTTIFSRESGSERSSETSPGAEDEDLQEEEVEESALVPEPANVGVAVPDGASVEATRLAV